MSQTTVARNYGEVLFDLAQRHDADEVYAQALDEIVSLFDDQPRLKTFFETPQIDAAAKKEVLGNVLGTRVPGPFLNYLMVVVDKRRQRLLGRIAEEYHRLLDEKYNRLDVEVTVASEPDEETEQAIRAGLSEQLGREIVPRYRVVPEILGGAIVRYGDRVVDGSLRRRMMILRRRMLSAALPHEE